MVVGKTLAAVTALVRAIAAREVQRRYLAIAHGMPPRRAFSVEAPIGRDPQAAHADGGRRLGQAGADRRRAHRRARRLRARCAARCTPAARTRSASTSRRAAMPLVGDRSTAARRRSACERQALHAAALAFAHPRSGAAAELRIGAAGRLRSRLGRRSPAPAGLNSPGGGAQSLQSAHSLSMRTVRAAAKRPAEPLGETIET